MTGPDRHVELRRWELRRWELRRWFTQRSRDVVILPAIFVMTPLLLLVVIEAACYRPFYQKLGDACLVDDPIVGLKARPNCTSRYKVADSAWIENRYNDCGYRSDQSCAPPPPGTIRAAVIGSSVSVGYMVGYQAMFATKAAQDLTRDCRRPVQFQNLGGVGYQWDRLYARMQEALAPQLLVITLTPYDLMQDASERPDEHKPAPIPNGLIQRIKFAVRDRIKQTAVWQALMYLGALNPPFSLRSYLRDDDTSGYLRTPLPASWQDRIARVDALLGRMADTALRFGTPLVLMYVPPRPQVLLLDRQSAYPQTAPTQLDDAIGSAANHAGIAFIDMTERFRAFGDPNRVFFTLSDHPTPLGHELMADRLEHWLQSAQIGAFGSCEPAMSASAAPPG